MWLPEPTSPDLTPASSTENRIRGSRITTRWSIGIQAFLPNPGLTIVMQEIGEVSGNRHTARRFRAMTNSTTSTPKANRSRDDHRCATESSGAKGKALIVSNNIRLEATRLLVYATLVAVTAVHATPSCGQDADIKKQLEGVDLEGVQQLRLSPNGEGRGFNQAL